LKRPEEYVERFQELLEKAPVVWHFPEWRTRFDQRCSSGL
jgi:hypothetical protein